MTTDGPGPVPAEASGVTVAVLLSQLAGAGVALRDEEVPGVLATARFLARAADLVRAATLP